MIGYVHFWLLNFFVIIFKTTTTSGAVKETTQNVRAGRGTMAEAEEDLVAYLWDKYKTTVVLYVTTATAICCHHMHPASLHAIRLLIHAYTHTAFSL